MRKRWKDSEGNIYEWDSQHGAVEKYNSRGVHLGEFDPNTGAQTSLPTKRERLSHEREPAMAWTIDVFDDETERLVEEHELKGVTVEKLREIFDQPPDAPMVDSFRV